jgi:hypothetical protein
LGIFSDITISEAAWPKATFINLSGAVDPPNSQNLSDTVQSTPKSSHTLYNIIHTDWYKDKIYSSFHHIFLIQCGNKKCDKKVYN